MSVGAVWGNAGWGEAAWGGLGSARAVLPQALYAILTRAAGDPPAFASHPYSSKQLSELATVTYTIPTRQTYHATTGGAGLVDATVVFTITASKPGVAAEIAEQIRLSCEGLSGVFAGIEVVVMVCRSRRTGYVRLYDATDRPVYTSTLEYLVKYRQEVK